VSFSSVVVSLPIGDRQRSFAFYRDDLVSTPSASRPRTVSEPPQFALNDGVRLMRVPTGGFGWVIGDREVARAGLLSWRGV
jgi:hypothetical protein